jgi:hypothetical protein
MAYQPIDEDRCTAAGRWFGFRLSSYVTCDVLAVRGVRMRNQRLVAMVSIVKDGYTGEWTSSLTYCERGDLVGEQPDDEEDGA